MESVVRMRKIDQKTIDNVLNNNADREDARSVAQWFSTPEGSVCMLENIDKDIHEIETESLALVEDEVNWKMYLRVKKQMSRTKIRRLVYWSAAALIPLFLWLGTVIFLNDRVSLFTSSEYEEIYVPKGEHLQVVLQDGTKIYLNSDSRIQYPKKFGLFERNIKLTGEAYFDVIKESKRKFVVELNGVNVEVLGTSFDVRAYPENRNVYVQLDEGKVIFKEVLTSKYTTMSPGDLVVYDRNKGSFTMAQEDITMQLTDWKQNQIVLDAAPLEEVINILSRSYDMKFIIKDEAAKKYQYTLTTNKINLREILWDLEFVSPVHFVEKDGVIEVFVNRK